MARMAMVKAWKQAAIVLRHIRPCGASDGSRRLVHIRGGSKLVTAKSSRPGIRLRQTTNLSKVRFLLDKSFLNPFQFCCQKQLAHISVLVCCVSAMPAYSGRSE